MQGGMGLIPGLETKIPHAAECSQKKKIYIYIYIQRPTNIFKQPISVVMEYKFTLQCFLFFPLLISEDSKEQCYPVF